MFHDVLFNKHPSFIFYDFIFYSKVALWPISHATKMLAVKMPAVTVLDMMGIVDEQVPGRVGQSPASRWIWLCWTDCVHLFVFRMTQTSGCWWPPMKGQFESQLYHLLAG